MPRPFTGRGQRPGQRIGQPSFAQFPQFSFGQFPLFPDVSPQPSEYPRVECAQRRGGLADREVAPPATYVLIELPNNLPDTSSPSALGELPHPSPEPFQALGVDADPRDRFMVRESDLCSVLIRQFVSSASAELMEPGSAAASMPRSW